MGKTVKIVLTPEQESWLVKHYKHTRNEEIVRRLGVSPRSVNRIAQRMGLKKSRQHIRKIELETTARMNAMHRVNGTYPPKGYKIPNGEKNHFKKGVKPVDRLGAAREAQRIAKGVRSRKETFRLEKARALYGLPRQTKLQVVKRPRKQVAMRYYLRQLGYIIDRGSCTAYYDKNTRRSRALESRPMTGFLFLELIN